MKFCLSILILFLSFPADLFAYPIPPVPLRQLILGSEYIVYANVIAIEEKETEYGWRDTRAILSINEIVQGAIRQDTISVAFEAGMVCPAPARYEVGSCVLAFLYRHRKSETLRTNSLSYGSKEVDEADYLRLRERIREMQAIGKIPNVRKKASATVDWLIQCAAHPLTRWDGVYELKPDSDFMTFYVKAFTSKSPRYQLNSKQRKRLRSLIFTTEKFRHYDMNMVDLVTEENDTEMLDFLTRKLVTSESMDYWHNSDLMIRIAIYSGRAELLEIVQTLEDLEYDAPDRDEKERILMKAFWAYL